MRNAFGVKLFQSIAGMLVGGWVTFASAGEVAIGQVEPAAIHAWTAFRSAQPFQTQVIAASLASRGQMRTLIFSEPPPHMTWEKLTGLLKPHLAGCVTRQWQIMAGGSVTDLVCSIKPVDPEVWA